MKNVKGITLIALVITIVVLIILAGVAISLSLGENGIFNKAKFATEEYANEQAKEETEIGKVSNEIDTIVNNSRQTEPSGSIDITRNGTYDVTNYATANVNVADNFYAPQIYSSSGFVSTSAAATYYTQAINVPEKVNEVYLFSITTSTYGSAAPVITGDIIQNTEQKDRFAKSISGVISETTFEYCIKTSGNAGTITVKMNSNGKGQHWGRLIVFFNNNVSEIETNN